MIFTKAILVMRKTFFIFFLAVTFASIGQTRGVKIGYIDMEYILQNVPDYTEAKNQLEQKAQLWKQEIETKKNDIARLKEALKTERVLLTKELIEDREEEIRFQESELSDYQQKRFGPTGDLMTQKAVLVKPIQDQVFNAAQDIAEARKYDFIFDKSSDMTMLFAAKRYDISDQVVRAITRASKRGQMSKKELKEEEAREAKEDMIDENPGLAERQKKLDERKAAREKLVADRKAAAEARRAEAEAKRNAGRDGKPKTEGKADGESAEPKSDDPQTEDKPKTNTAAEDARAAAAAERERKLEERKQALEERKAKVLADREAAKKAREEKNNKKPETDTVPGQPKNEE
jgi:Skp family chaperone for outer membrane proteins